MKGKVPPGVGAQLWGACPTGIDGAFIPGPGAWAHGAEPRLRERVMKRGGRVRASIAIVAVAVMAAMTFSGAEAGARAPGAGDGTAVPDGGSVLAAVDSASGAPTTFANIDVN